MRLIEYLFHRPGAVGPVFDRWGSVLLGAFLGLLVALLVLGYLLRVFSEGHTLHAALAQKVVRYGIAVQLAGLLVLVLGLRVINFPGLSMPLSVFAADRGGSGAGVPGLVDAHEVPGRDRVLRVGGAEV